MIAALSAFAVILALSLLGAPLAFSVLLTAFVGFAMLRGVEAATVMSGTQIVEFATNFNLSVIPLFVLMGGFIHRAKISDELYEAGYAWLGRLRGGLAMSTILACAGFSAVCGSSLATAATMSRVAMPQMRRFRYDDGLSTGALAAGGTLGIMIPPSVPMVIYGIVAEEDIGEMFVAGILPGMLMVALFLAAVAVVVAVRPDFGPKGEKTAMAEKWKTAAKTWPVAALFVAVLGGIYLGVFTPTEAAAVGAFGAYWFAFFRGRLRSWPEILDAVVEAAKTTAIIFAVVFSAGVLEQFVNLSGMPFALVDIAADSDPLALVLSMSVICVLLGTIFEAIGILLLVVPVFLPALHAAGVDMIWFGIIAIIVVEMGLITPPIGMNVFTVKSVVRDVPLSRMFAGVAPFIVADLVVLGLIIAFPAIAVWLPALMR